MVPILATGQAGTLSGSRGPLFNTCDHKHSCSAFAVCPAGLLGLVKMPPWLLSLLSVECLFPQTGKQLWEWMHSQGGLPFTALRVTGQPLCEVPRSSLLQFWRERRSVYLLQLPPRASSTSTFRHIDVSDVYWVVWMSSVGLWMSFSLYLRVESLRQELTPPWCWHHLHCSFSFSFTEDKWSELHFNMVIRLWIPCVLKCLPLFFRVEEKSSLSFLIDLLEILYIFWIPIICPICLLQMASHVELAFSLLLVNRKIWPLWRWIYQCFISWFYFWSCLRNTYLYKFMKIFCHVSSIIPFKLILAYFL